MKRTLLMVVFTATMYSGFSQVIWGENNSRTEWRNDAGLQGNAGAISGFYQASIPVNYPAGASGWWHLLDVRHVNPENNFAMQFAGSFFDQNLFFRKTNNNPSQLWSRILTENNDGLVNTLSHNQGNVLRNVFARMIEGDGQGDGTYLGVKAYGTQPTEHDGKSFSIEHHFYGDLNSAINFYRGMGQTGGFITFATSTGTERMRIDNNGFVGIGTSTPTEKLSVNGNIRTRKVIVTQSGWPDYVFEPNYQLPSLDSVHNFIKENKHLPEIPTAVTIEKDGHDLGEVQKLLLKKVEELTLYMIEQDKKMKELQENNQKQQAVIDVQNQKIETQNKQIATQNSRIEQLEKK